jgi:hypothetical protein
VESRVARWILWDAGGDLDEPTRDELENSARSGNVAAQSALIERAMKRTVLAARY